MYESPIIATITEDGKKRDMFIILYLRPNPWSFRLYFYNITITLILFMYVIKNSCET